MYEKCTNQDLKKYPVKIRFEEEHHNENK